MDKIIDSAISLGKLIQRDDRFIAYSIAKQTQDENVDFQTQMDTFENKRTQLTIEVQKADKDPEKLKILDKELKELYNGILEDDGYKKLSVAQEKLQEMLNAITQIINGSADGLAPEEINYTAECSPSGCGGCSGCK